MARILVVEDDEILRNGIAFALTREGYQVKTAGSLSGMRGQPYFRRGKKYGLSKVLQGEAGRYAAGRRWPGTLPYKKNHRGSGRLCIHR